MESIVSPWFIYALDVVTNLGTMVSGGVIVFIALSCIAGFILFIFAIEGEVSPVTGFLGKLKGFAIFMAILLLLLSIFVPTKGTLIGMAVADGITYDRAGKMMEMGGELKDIAKKDIIDVIEAFGKEEAVEVVKDVVKK